MIPWIDLQCVILASPGQIHLLFKGAYYFSIDIGYKMVYKFQIICAVLVGIVSKTLNYILSSLFEVFITHIIFRAYFTASITRTLTAQMLA